MEDEEIRLDPATEHCISIMAGKNPDTRDVCRLLVTEGGRVDPDMNGGGFAHLKRLDEFGIHEERIRALYAVVCGEHIGDVIVLIRAHLLGIEGVNTKTINDAIDGRGGGFDFEALVRGIRVSLPKFDPKYARAMPAKSAR